MRRRGVNPKSRVPAEQVEELLEQDPRFRLSVQRNGRCRKRRRWCSYSSMCPQSEFGVVDASVDSLLQAITERSFFVQVGDHFELPLRVKNSEYRCDSLADFQKSVVEHVGEQATIGTLRETVNLFHGAKHTRYVNAYNSLMKDPVSKKDRMLSNFIKFGKDRVDKAARLINPPSARLGLEMARFLKPNEHLYFSGINAAWGERTSATVIKGLDIYCSAEVLLDKWNMFQEPVAIGLDASKFDMHVTQQALKYEHSFYNDVFRDPHLAELLSWQLSSKSVGYVRDGKVVASFPGTRCSGDMNTSLGNCIIMSGLIHAYCAEHSIVAELANNGDDCVVFIERTQLDSFMRDITPWFAAKGFRMTVEDPVYEFEQIEFCQAHPVNDGNRWRMVRNPITCLIKDPMCLKPIDSIRGLNKWRGAVGTGGLSLTSGIPVLQAFYSAMRRNTRKCSARYLRNVIFDGTGALERGASLSATECAINANTRASFAAAFNISPAEQIAIERYYDSVVLSDELQEHTLAPPPIIDLASIVFTKS